MTHLGKARGRALRQRKQHDKSGVQTLLGMFREPQSLWPMYREFSLLSTEKKKERFLNLPLLPNVFP